MLGIEFLQIPPTPTFLPPAPTAPITIDPGEFSMWVFAPEAVGWWNNYQGVGQIAQLIILAFLLFLIGGFILKSITAINKERQE